MKTPTQFRHFKCKGVTLIELTIVILILLLLVSSAFLGVGYFRDWQKGVAASEDLKEVYAAQRLYLSEHPTVLVTDLTKEKVVPYLPDGAADFPVVKGLDDQTLTIDITKSPPVFMDGGTVYDPSGSTTDNLWDAGK
ncbi:prepilin-type N-terminal cleavage/methylation domain-containing protein [Rubritalea squalenifaciens DSM 18772]|uniref:Prepilin-type N-terminal cleavage/methylation domain-containing protein n=1 Tax=Rubritalea squalenifaciens DSM 18772 TaxID=1123071 RepID=A0A1M6RKT5_9BACT|nr:prepilin-type N-terminal cleavage/methylation domain-containing protein [Rubritalea squalenifaciens]SHK33054.1 prepilin-type N-terminal cleavage/methylation domain-containing protein [Rubritalea squalenifaciens DSM 18772]